MNILETGEVKRFGPRNLASLGISERKGIFLKRIIQNMGAKRIFELGSGNGNSGFFIGSPDSVRELITVEGSKDLSNLAHETLKIFDVPHKIMNMHFKNAIEEVEGDFDFVYIDGHHEKKATLKYFKKISGKLKKDSVVVFDDIYWSRDMFDCWKILESLEDFSFTINTGWFGVCVYNPEVKGCENIDLTNLLGEPIITKPWGWEEN